ncbi:MAG: LptF/LptG family permease, partial [Prolixibacteraceae bacterium]
YSIKVGEKDSKNNMLYDLLIYDHRSGKTNQSVTVADSGFVKITEDKKYMVMNLYDGANYSEEESKQRGSDQTYPYRRDNFEEQTVRIELRGFDFNRRDESIFKNAYRMLNIEQLALMDDTLSDNYRSRLRNYIMQLNFNRPLEKKFYNLTAPHDSLKRNIEIEEPDSLFNVEELFGNLKKWQKAEIAQAALNSARSNVQQLNMFDDQLYNQKKQLNQYKMERHRKFTLALAVLIFFFIGAPLGAIIRKGGLGMPVVVSILLFIAYYIVSMTGEKSAREDVWDMYSGMWFSTLIFLPVGIWLSYKAATDAALMNADTYSKLIGKLGIGKLLDKRKKQK